jgi:chromosome segregation ATPase
LRQLKAVTDQKIDELGRENWNLQSALTDLEQTVADNGETIKKLKRDLVSAKQDLKTVESTSSLSESSLKSEHDQAFEALQQRAQQIQKQLNDHIANLTAQLGQAADNIAVHESTIDKLQKQVRAQQKAIAEKNQQVVDLQNAKESELAQLVSQTRIEKENLTESYENAISELKTQCDAHRSDVERVAHDLGLAEEVIHKAKSTIVAAKREKAKLQKELQSLHERMERDSEVTQAMIKSATLSAETTANEKVREFKAKNENERRRLFALAADEFRSFFNAAEAIDERSYRGLLHRVKTELKRLSDSDAVVRRLVGASPKQSTDDAVAQVLVP